MLNSLSRQFHATSKFVKPLKRVFVEGNIGSGKTELLNFLRQTDLPCDIQDEPINKWRNICGKYNLFNLMYEDPSRWGFAFQSYVQLTMFQNHITPPKKNNSIILSERSLHSARKIFVENLFASGFLRPEEFAILDEFYQELAPNCKTDLYIYLKTRPEKCLSRIHHRNRPEEKAISEELLQQLHDLHETWLTNQCPVEIITVDADKPLEFMRPTYEEIAQKLLHLEDDGDSPIQLRSLLNSGG